LAATAAEQGACVKTETASSQLANAAAEKAANSGSPTAQYLSDQVTSGNDFLQAISNALSLPTDSVLRMRIVAYFRSNSLPTGGPFDQSYGPLAKIFVAYCKRLGL
jgi:hypothetical protein